MYQVGKNVVPFKVENIIKLLLLQQEVCSIHLHGVQSYRFDMSHILIHEGIKIGEATSNSQSVWGGGAKASPSPIPPTYPMYGVKLH